MSSGTFYPSVSADDGWWRAGHFQAASSSLYIGHATGWSMNSFVRCPNVTIPQGSIITSAFIRLKAIADGSNVVVNTNIYFNDVDDAVAPVNEAGANALAKTAAIAWNAIPGWTAGVQYDSPELKTILQTVIDRAGFSSGDALQFVILDNSSTNGAGRFPSAVDDSGGVNKAELHITWTAPVRGDINVTNPMMQAQGYTGIYAAPSVPMMQANATLSDNIIHVNASATAPMMTASLTQAKQIWGAVTIPMMTAKLTERESVLGNVTIPMMTAELTSGVHVTSEVSIPMMTAEGLFSGQCNVTVPMMTVEMAGVVGRVIHSDVSIPMMTAELTGKVGRLVNCDVSIPMMRVSAHLMTGKIITGAAEIPMMTADLTSYEDIDGDIAVSIPMMKVYMTGTTERPICTALRYDDKPDILGDIAVEIPMMEASLTDV